MNVMEDLLRTLQQELRDTLMETSKQVYQKKLEEYADLYKQQLPGLIQPLFESMNHTVKSTMQGGVASAAPIQTVAPETSAAISLPVAATIPASTAISLPTAAAPEGLVHSLLSTLMHSITKKLDAMILESFESDFQIFRSKFTEGSELETALLTFAKEHISTNFLLLMGATNPAPKVPTPAHIRGGRRSRRKQRMYHAFGRYRR